MQTRVDNGQQAGLPAVTLSLDFELRWGMHDLLGLDRDNYREPLENTRAIVVPAMARLFADHGVRATWAAVGALGCRDWTEYFARAPKPPAYENPVRAIDPRYADMDPDGALHFCPELLDLIRATPGQDLGTHTFSHLYLSEKGVTAADAAADLRAVRQLWRERFGGPPTSFVFPRHQVAFIDVIREHAIRIWRGAEKNWYASNGTPQKNKLPMRVLRFMDAIIPLRSLAYPLEADMVRSSLFVRLHLDDAKWKWHFSRIRNGITTVQPGQIFHIWWHPHNAGIDVAKRLQRITDIVDIIAQQCAKGKIVSKSMQDLAG